VHLVERPKDPLQTNVCLELFGKFNSVLKSGHPSGTSLFNVTSAKRVLMISDHAQKQIVLLRRKLERNGYSLRQKLLAPDSPLFPLPPFLRGLRVVFRHVDHPTSFILSHRQATRETSVLHRIKITSFPRALEPQRCDS
jgi:hypothetical protein